MPSSCALEPIERVTFTIAQFCQYVGISRPFYYTLGLDKPAEIRIGGKILIFKDAADEWLHAHESKAA